MLSTEPLCRQLSRYAINTHTNCNMLGANINLNSEAEDQETASIKTEAKAKRHAKPKC